MEAAFFWIVWGFISLWVLKTFFYSFSKEKLERLRKSALGINLAVLVLTFLPWVSSSGSSTGLTFALEGNILALLFLILLVTSVLLFLKKNSSLLKLAGVLTIVNSLLLFVIMYQLRPNTFILSFYDIAPIIAALLLLVADSVVLLLWQQLVLKQKRRKRNIINR